MKSCFLFGHSICPETVISKVEQAIEDCYVNQGIQSFYLGNRGWFDSYAATAAKRVKQRHPDIQLYLLLAYHPAEREVNMYTGFDGSYYPPLENVPRKFAIVKANQYMVSTSDAVICYVNHLGNARNLLEYAQKRHAYIINVAD